MGASRFPSLCDRIWMAKTASSLTAGLGRFVKAIMVAVLMPIAIGLLQGILDQLETVSGSGSTFRAWVSWGFITYVGIHLLLYRPVGLFRASHRLFSWLAAWLFGGQVASVGTQESGGKKKEGKRGKGEFGEASADGSTLVAFSPYVIPSYMILMSAAAIALRRWLSRSWVDGPVSFLLGAFIAFHWLMTANDLQEQRDRWHVETYLLAITLVFIVTLLIGGACVPWAIPEFSFLQAFSEGYARTQAVYAALIRQLFL